jgi:O-antigen/teichoic acid export membrane protein
LLGLNSIGTRVIVFFLVPLYTNVLTTKEYGIVDLFSTVLVVMIPITTLNIGEAIMRFSMDKDAPLEDISRIANLFIVMSVGFCLSIYPLVLFFPQLEPYKNYLFLYAAADSVYQTAVYNLRGREQLTDFALSNIILTLLIALLNIYFLLGLKIGLKGYFLSYAISNVIGAVYAFIRGRLYKGFGRFSINKSLAKDMIKYSIVLVPNSFMWWIMNSSDRIMVTSMVGLAQNGIYGVSYKIPTIMSTLSGVFNQAWNYTAVKESESEDKDSINNYVFDKLVRIVILLIAIILLFLKPFMSLYVSKDFFSAWKYVPPLIIGFGFMTAGTFLSSAYTVQKDCKGFLISGTIGAIVNIALNFLLIPLIGTMGAAVATCMSYIAVFVFRWKDTKKYVNIKKPDNSVLLGLLCVVIMSILVYYQNLACAILESLLFLLVIVLNWKLFMALGVFFKASVLKVKKKGEK